MSTGEMCEKKQLLEEKWWMHFPISTVKGCDLRVNPVACLNSFTRNPEKKRFRAVAMNIFLEITEVSNVVSVRM